MLLLFFIKLYFFTTCQYENNLINDYESLSLKEISEMFCLNLLLLLFEHAKKHENNFYDSYYKNIVSQELESLILPKTKDCLIKIILQKCNSDLKDFELKINCIKFIQNIKFFNINIQNKIKKLCKLNKNYNEIVNNEQFVKEIFYIFISACKKDCEVEINIQNHFDFINSLHYESYLQIYDEKPLQKFIFSTKTKILAEKYKCDVVFLDVHLYKFYLYHFIIQMKFFIHKNKNFSKKKNYSIIKKKVTKNHLNFVYFLQKNDFYYIKYQEREYHLNIHVNSLKNSMNFYINYLEFEIIGNTVEYWLCTFFQNDMEIVNHFKLVFLNGYYEFYCTFIKFLQNEILFELDKNTCMKSIFIFKLKA